MRLTWVIYEKYISLLDRNLYSTVSSKYKL